MRYSGENSHIGGSEGQSWEKERLVYFPAGSFVSAPAISVTFGELFNSPYNHIYTMEILPAHLQNTVDFPAHLHTINDAGKFVWHGDQVILRDHPLLQEHRLGKPPRLNVAFD